MLVCKYLFPLWIFLVCSHMDQRILAQHWWRRSTESSAAPRAPPGPWSTTRATADTSCPARLARRARLGAPGPAPPRSVTVRLPASLSFCPSHGHGSRHESCFYYTIVLVVTLAAACPTLTAPANGNVLLPSSLSVGNAALYSCNAG